MIFAQLDTEDHCQNFIIDYRFLAAMVHVLGDQDAQGRCRFLPRGSSSFAAVCSCWPPKPSRRRGERLSII